MRLFKKIIFIFIVFSASTCIVSATSIKAKITLNNVYVRTGPGTNHDEIRQLAIDAVFPLANEEKYANEKGCSSGWYKIEYSKGKEGYICTEYVELITVEEVTDEPSNECETALKEAGFPKSYWNGLCALKELHPGWNFVADANGLNFLTSADKESVVGKSLIQTANQGYLSTKEGSYNYETDTFTVKEGKNWYAANEKTVAYYMDPRNFFDEKNIFMFEKLSFDESYQTEDAIKKVLQGRDIIAYSNIILKASQENNVNAIYLASKIRQETGGNFSNTSLMGLEITSNGKYYASIFNPYNIGANTGAMDGLVWAASGSSYLRPWTTLSGAIMGGAQVISNTYISKGQDTIYYQKFNASSYSDYASYAHQYMTNIKAASSEALIAYEGYKGMDLLDTTSFTFVIPVYYTINESNLLPEPGNPNNHLKSIQINGENISGFAHNKYEYTYYVPDYIASVEINAQSINSAATINGIGKVDVPNEENTITLEVIAGNKEIQNYIIKVFKTTSNLISANDIAGSMGVAISDTFMILSGGKTVNKLIEQAQKIAASAIVTTSGNKNGNIATGDVITIKNGDTSVSYSAVIKGDPSGDGNINIQDLLKIQKHILGYAALSGSYLKASDVNQDGNVDIADLLKIQKHILGYLVIE